MRQSVSIFASMPAPAGQAAGNKSYTMASAPADRYLRTPVHAPEVAHRRAGLDGVRNSKTPPLTNDAGRAYLVAMKHAITGLAISALLTFTSHAFAQETPRRAVGLGAVGQAVPGASVLSTARIAVTPAAGGNTVYLPLAADGSFKADGLAPGRYRLAVTSHITGKQTQGSTFGEKVNQGLHAAGSAVASGATSAKHDTVKNSINNVRAAEAGPSDPAASSAQEGAAGKMKIDGSMPNRISMNVTIAKQDRVLELDGPDMEIEVADGQALSGRAVVR